MKTLDRESLEALRRATNEANRKAAKAALARAIVALALFSGAANAAPIYASAKHCPELPAIGAERAALQRRHASGAALWVNHLEYRDTLDACKWDYEHPAKHGVAK